MIDRGRRTRTQEDTRLEWVRIAATLLDALSRLADAVSTRIR